MVKITSIPSRIAKSVQQRRDISVPVATCGNQELDGATKESGPPKLPRQVTVTQSRPRRERRRKGRMSKERRRERRKGERELAQGRPDDQEGSPQPITDLKRWAERHPDMGSSFYKYEDCPTHRGLGSIDLPHKIRRYPRIEERDRNVFPTPGLHPEKPRDTDVFGNQTEDMECIYDTTRNLQHPRKNESIEELEKETEWERQIYEAIWGNDAS
jgi:hypothetical protein